MNGKDDEDLERVKAFEWGPIRIASGYEGGQLHEATALALDVSETRDWIVVQKRRSGTQDGACERDDGLHRREADG